MKSINYFYLLKKAITIVSLLLVFIVSSCRDDDDRNIRNNNDTEQPPSYCDNDKSVLTIGSLSKDFLIVGDTLAINGKNFINDNNDTQLIINDSVFYVKPVSNTEIKLQITEEISIERDSLFVKIGDSISESRHFFVVPKGWYKINAFEKEELNKREYREQQYNNEIIKSFVFDDTNSLISLLKDVYSRTDFTGNVERLEADSMGYSKRTRIQEDVRNLEMFNKDVGVYMNDKADCYFTSNSFSSYQPFGNFVRKGASLENIRILFDDEKSCIILNSHLASLRTDDAGSTFSFVSKPDYLSDNITITYSAYVKADTCFYAIGRSYNQSSKNDTIVVLKKGKGSLKWESPYGTASSTSAPASNFNNAKFKNINYILTQSLDNNFLYSDNMGKSWETINTEGNRVKSFFMRDEDEWYIVSSDNELYSTKDKGTSWNKELVLSKNSIVNHISFSKSKIILSGLANNVSLLYIKHE